MGRNAITSVLLVVAALAMSTAHGEAARPQAPGERNEDVYSFTEAVRLLQEDFVEDIDVSAAVKNAIRGLLAPIDPHGGVIDRDEIATLQATAVGPGGGIGVELADRAGDVVVVRTFPAAPAQRAGILAGDVIIAVDDLRLAGKPLARVLERLQGPVGSHVSVSVLRDPGRREARFDMARADILSRSVTWRKIGADVAYVRIVQFRDQTGEEFATILRKLFAEGWVRGLVLDLRDNPGGFLNNAIGTAAALLPRDSLVVTVENPRHGKKQELFARKEDYLYVRRDDYLAGLDPRALTLPIVVLVNARTASSAEIVAAALQDHHRARLVGTTTFGKGSVQTVVGLPNGLILKYTSAHYVTPAGRRIDGTGIAPDVVIGREIAASKPDQPVDHVSDAAARKALEVIEALRAAPNDAGDR